MNTVDRLVDELRKGDVAGDADQLIGLVLPTGLLRTRPAEARCTGGRLRLQALKPARLSSSE